MASASQCSTWPVIPTSSNDSTTTPSPSTALDLIAAIATGDLREYTPHELGIHGMDNIRSMDDRTIGRGGLGVVEVGQTIENRLVAIKRLRTSAKDAQADFETHLRHICLEMRILCHEPLKSHPNILDIIGYCLSEVPGHQVPFLALVLEYSSEGSLKTFLSDHGEHLQTSTLVNMAAQVADGLGSLHKCSISHGDVKIQNALVFKNVDSWTVKLSDFGASAVGQIDDPSLAVGRGPGTRLLNAPEVRNNTASTGDHFTIDDAIRADIFSFGLLTWEILKRGESYFDKYWCMEWDENTEVDIMEEYLEMLPRNGLLSKACNYIQGNFVGTGIEKSMVTIFGNSLQDDPSERSSMEKIREYFGTQSLPIL
jgi:serine/threonine protein kinase